MKVTGFSFIRNALKFDFPIIEAIQSILPICDDFVIAVGKSEDKTLDLIQSINTNNKIKIIETVWDDSMRTGGRVLAIETDKAFQAVPKDSDWAFYIQGDEIVHERDLDTIYNAMNKWKSNKEVDGLLFNYLHFYGSYDYVGGSSKWYKNEIRVIRNEKSIYSYRDAQGFRKGNNQKLKVVPIDAYIHHYGWVKEPRVMQQKYEGAMAFWHDDKFIREKTKGKEEFDYHEINSLKRFQGTHPAVMKNRIERKNWQFIYDLSFNRILLKDVFKNFIKKVFGISLGYKNYIINNKNFSISPKRRQRIYRLN